MINKVERLTSIGKYRAYQASGQVNFKKLTLIYGENGSGKTTLTSIFRSLTNNDPEIIKSRISTNHIAPQSAQITQVSTPNIFHTFGSSGWSVAFPNIEIFDIHFVNDNVYSGFDFNDEHRKQLHQFVIGAQGVAIQNQIEQNKTDKATSRQDQANIQQQIIQQVGNNLTPDLITPFLRIPSSDAQGIDQKINTAETTLTNANANAVIRTLQTLSVANNLSTGIDFSSLSADLQASSESIQNAALETLFTDHCEELKNNDVEGPESWLQKGFAYIKKRLAGDSSEIACPFCKQSIDNSADILTAYSSKFNQEFNALVERLKVHRTSLQSFNLEAKLQEFNTLNQNNAARIVSWTQHLPNTTQAPDFNIIDDEARLKTEFQNIIALVDQKLQNPTGALPIIHADSFQTSIQSINTRVGVYNQSVTGYNSAISTFRSSIQSVPDAQKEVDRLKRIKKRFETPIDTLCSQLTTEKQILRTLESTYRQLVQQQETAATLFFTNYQTRINHYLTNVFRTHFRIEDVNHVAPQGRATQSKVAYKLTIDGNDISFSPNQPFNAKECLSEGDKSTIALAFFLSKLDIDTNKSDKVLIFDDPLSSLDTNRRSYTIRIIKELFQQLKQVVVLSHNEYFLHEVGKDIRAADKVALRITENFAAKASKIETCDLKELVKIEYFKHLDALEAFRINPDHSQRDLVLGWLRNVLEAHIRFKFYREIRSMTGQQTFGRLINFMDNFPVVFRDNTNRSSIISTLHLINGVSWKPHHGDPSPNYSTLGMNPNSITASELDNLIQDTINLIDVRL
ncbi:MAG: AAA family ATPase [Candidatus Paceibacterota bacterium]